MRPRLVTMVLLALAGCPRGVPALQTGATENQAQQAKARQGSADPLADDVVAITTSLEQYLRAQDEALWAQWTAGQGADFEALRARHGALFRSDALLTVRQARTHQPQHQRALMLLEYGLAGMQISTAAAVSEVARANLEASLTFSVDGRDTSWRELPRLLGTEPSALKRKALWTSSFKATERIAALIESRDSAVDKAHRNLGYEPVAFDEAHLDVDLDAAAELAESVLARTEGVWRATLERRARDELKLPVDRMTRADLPRLMRPAPAVDAAFPKDAFAARGRAAIARLLPVEPKDFDFALDDARVKGALPLGLLVSAHDARLAMKPQAGLRAQATLLFELGRLIARHAAGTQRFEYARLGTPNVADAVGALYESLLGNPAWLVEQRQSPATAAAVRQAYADARLYDARRNAAGVLSAVALRDLPLAEAREQWRRLAARATGLAVGADEDPRFRLELEGGFAPARALVVRAEAAWLASQLAARFGPAWWSSPEAAAEVRAACSAGTAVPIEERLAALPVAGQEWLRALGAGAEPTPDAGTPEARVGGKWVPVPFPSPRTLAERGAWVPVPWGEPRRLSDGGTWSQPPAPVRSVTDAGTPDGGTPRSSGASGRVSAPGTAADGGTGARSTTDGGRLPPTSPVTPPADGGLATDAGAVRSGP